MEKKTRAIPPGKERRMKPEEAIERLEYLESALDGYPPETGINDVFAAIDTAIKALEEIQQYRETGTVKEFREAMEKQKPKKPHRNYKKFSGLWCKCGWYLGQKQCLDIKYCPNCGQAIAENLEGMEDEQL